VPGAGGKGAEADAGLRHAVTNGMKVFTHSELAVKAQKAVMEFLLINHPLDCPICDQGGECQLQDLAVGYGDSASKYEEEKRVVPDKDLGPLVSTDMTRCINCTRCIRFTAEIAGFMELGQSYRGERAEVMPFIGKTVDTELSGNIIDLCPVGALTSKPFRFSARTWELSRRKSVSPHDALGSNLIVQTKHDKVMRVLPLENEDINECWLTDKERFSYQGLNSADRLTKPMVKQGGEWKEVDWNVALDYAATPARCGQDPRWCGHRRPAEPACDAGRNVPRAKAVARPGQRERRFPFAPQRFLRRRQARRHSRGWA
jgi:NADH-quinone oxidoreductase subunit G